MRVSVAEREGMELVGGRNCLGGDLWNLWRNKRGYFFERRRERGRQRKKEEESCFVRRGWEGQGKEGKEKEAFSLKCPSLPLLRFIACGCFATSERY